MNLKEEEQVLPESGGLKFMDASEKWGVADAGYSINATFVDFDLDGDLDLYVVNQPPNSTTIRRSLRGK